MACVTLPVDGVLAGEVSKLVGNIKLIDSVQQG